MEDKLITNIYDTGRRISNGSELLTLDEAREKYEITCYPRSNLKGTLGVVDRLDSGKYTWSPVTLDMAILRVNGEMKALSHEQIMELVTSLTLSMERINNEVVSLSSEDLKIVNRAKNILGTNGEAINKYKRHYKLVEVYEEEDKKFLGFTVKKTLYDESGSAVLSGDWYTNKISSLIDGFLTGLEYAGIEYEVVVQKVNEKKY
jgi:hypothetical protein